MRRPGRELHHFLLQFVPLVALLMFCALGYVWLRLGVTEVAYRLSTMQEVVARLEEEQQELRLEVAAAESPARLAEMGRELGLAPPEWGGEVTLP